MALEPTTNVLVGIAGWHLLLGAILVFAVYWLMEHRLSTSLLLGLSLIGTVVVAETVLGEVLFALTYAELRGVVQVAIASAAVGAVLTSLAFEPNIDRT